MYLNQVSCSGSTMMEPEVDLPYMSTFARGSPGILSTAVKVKIDWIMALDDRRDHGSRVDRSMALELNYASHSSDLHTHLRLQATKGTRCLC
jgi:hypothetical protein